ncbi:Snare domain containing protein [Mycena venus]|uniref:Snare domain containing protein n=1 Tax=Mycena venus TaxID=2733690 RepID=A0A8H6XWN6_9AGAR|nr:Snare domain containing protein [Mycena venus]
MNLLLLSATVFALILAVFWMARRKRPSSSADPYGEFHLAFNRRPGEDVPRTEWLNMGIRLFFPRLAKALLALKLVEAAGYVGHGTGESLILLLTHPSVPRPAHLTGITSLASHRQRSQARVARLSQPVPVALHAGDAVFRPGARGHPLDPSSAEDDKFDTILALDCAYHFRSRRDFLRQAHDRLRPGGVVALADICFANGTVETWWMAVLGSVLGMPRENRISTDEYTAQMRGIYTKVELEDITQDVFPGFISFLSTRGMGWWIFSRVFSFFWKSGARFIIARGERAAPSPHTVYEIHVKANVRDWQIWRRYSEFDDLHSALKDACGEHPPAPLPSKHALSIFRSHSDPKLLEERRTGLETYLRAIVSAKDEKWRETFVFKQFLGIPIGKQGPGSGEYGQSDRQFTLASWLDEHIDLQARIRDVRADLNKRDALSDIGDPNGAHSSNVAAKKKLAGVITRVGRLATGLQELAMGGMSEGELQRRTDMIARLRDDCEKLGKMVTVARLTSRVDGAAGGSAASRNPAADSDREALIGGTSRSPPRVPKSFGRVFGAAAAPKPQETEETRPLDDQGLFMLQEQKMQQQDHEVSQLTAVLQRQRHLGEAIGNELAIQIELLDDLANRVDETSGKIATTNREMGRLGRG